MHCVGIRILSAKHMLNEWFEQISEPLGIGVEKEWKCREEHVNGLRVTI